MSKTNEIKEKVTNKIIEKLEQGRIPWQKSWHSNSSLDLAISYVSGKPYRGVNQLLLDEGEYLTFNQIRKLKGKLAKGSKGNLITFWKQLEIEDEQSGEKKTIPFLRTMVVFNILDTDLKPKYDKRREYEELTDDKAEVIDEYFETYLSKDEIEYIEKEQNEAFYSPMQDLISMPLFKQFKSVAEYYGTKAHEFVHSTAHPKRLNRDLSGSFGTKNYAKEELVAEIGASMFLSYFNIDTTKSFENNVAYIQSWISKLKDDNNLIISASSKSQKAVDLLLGA